MKKQSNVVRARCVQRLEETLMDSIEAPDDEYKKLGVKGNNLLFDRTPWKDDHQDNNPDADYDEYEACKVPLWASDWHEEDDQQDDWELM